jgi:hypothetical protein
MQLTADEHVDDAADFRKDLGFDHYAPHQDRGIAAIASDSGPSNSS